MLMEADKVLEKIQQVKVLKSIIIQDLCITYKHIATILFSRYIEIQQLLLKLSDSN